MGMRRRMGGKPQYLTTEAQSLEAGLCMGCGIFLLLVAVLIGCHQVIFMARAQIAPGIVTNVEHLHSTSKYGVTTIDSPTVTFFNSLGRPTTITPKEAWGFVHYSVGQKINMLYLPDKPDDAQIDSFVPMFGSVAAIGAIGVIFIVSSLSLIKRRRREFKR
jgi:hypothetical protein